MRFLFISALLLMLGVSTASGAKMTKISGAKTDGQTILCNQYIGQDAKAHHEAIKKLDEKLSNKLEAIIKFLQGQAASTCKEIYDKNLHKGNKAYLLEVGSVKIPVYCHMTSTGLGACGGGGWTLVMKIDGTKKTFHYNSKLWSNKNEYNIFPGGKTGLDSQETKLPTYWNTPFSKICLGMKIGTQIKFIVINKQANSLYSLIADGKYRATSLARNTWKTLIGSGASLQRNCNKQGFNAMCHAKYSRARIGFVGNNENDCKSCDSRIGFGAAGYPHHSDTCGNVAKHGGDNGDKLIKTMGYILVQ